MVSVQRGDFSAIPVLDVAGLYSDDEGRRSAIADGTAALSVENIGFVYVAGHRIPPDRRRGGARDAESASSRCRTRKS